MLTHNRQLGLHFFLVFPHFDVNCEEINGVLKKKKSLLILYSYRLSETKLIIRAQGCSLQFTDSFPSLISVLLTDCKQHSP